ncbi:MAG: cell division protein SepF [Eubacteriales bacterium]|nr:cell division protein SepF [Eubacteriales bacterium]
MSFVDKILSAIRINDDYDEEDDEFFDEEDDGFEEQEVKPKKSFKDRFGSKSKKYEYDFEDDDFDDEPVPMKPAAKPAPVKKPAIETKPAASRYSAPTRPAAASQKITPMNRKGNFVSSGGMEVCVIKPTKVEDYREIADTLLSGCMVVLNLEGIDVELAQRIIDFSSGSCYAIEGGLQKVSSYIFLLSPSTVEISGDIQDLLSGAIPTMRTSF